MKKWIIIAIVCVLTIGGGVWYFTKGGSEPVVGNLVPVPQLVNALIQWGTGTMDLSSASFQRIKRSN